MGISPTTSNVLTSLRTFLQDPSVLGPAISVVTGQVNRVAEPASTSFVVMSVPRYERIETSVEESVDCAFTASISGTTMTVTDLYAEFVGRIAVGATVFGAGVAPGTTVTAEGTGTGGVGTYTVSQLQTVASGKMSAGSTTITQNSKATVQLDFHSADVDSGDMAQTFTTVFRSAFGVDLFQNQNPNYGVVPLYCDDARQAPFVNDQQQVEYRWVAEAVLQINMTVTVPQQFADAAVVDLVSVDATYPP